MFEYDKMNKAIKGCIVALSEELIFLDSLRADPAIIMDIEADIIQLEKVLALVASYQALES